MHGAELMAYWGNSDPLWLSLSPTQKAAAMALLEADRANPNDARNVLGAMINRAEAEGVDLGQSVSGKIYQPTIEPAQQARLGKVIQHPAFAELNALAQSRMLGETPDWVQGATHFLAPEKTMLALESKEPNKYRSWRSWTGYDPDSGSYSGVVMRDNSHAFLIPGGKSIAAPAADAPQTQTAEAAPKQDSKMIDILGMLSKFGGGLGGKGTVPGVEALGSPEDESLFGSLSAFGGGGKGSTGAGSDANLATEAMKQAGGGMGMQGQQMARKPFDMQQLQSILQRVGRLGTGVGGGGMA